MDKGLLRLSKFLSLILRHKPEEIGLEIGAGGWMTFSSLRDACQVRGIGLTLSDLMEVVGSNDKQRFAVSEDGLHIRASQGHSIKVDLGYEPMSPPGLLYHGTAERFLSPIRQEGLLKRNRQHVHLSAAVETVLKIGQRHGKPVVLTVQAARMFAYGLTFYLSDNRVGLTEHVPPEYLLFPSRKGEEADADERT